MPETTMYSESGHPLLRAARSLPPWLVPAYARRRAVERGADDVTVYLQDYDQRLLVPLTEEASAEAATGAVAIEGTLAGRAYTLLRPVDVADEGGGRRLLLPLVDGGDRVGVLDVRLPHEVGDALEEWEEFASATAALIVSKGAHTDVYFQARRRQSMTLAAEMQWGLLPPLSVFDPRLVLSGAVEPAYAVGGDAFDYAINPTTAHVAVLDAMGHGLDAAVMASVAVGAYRHARRQEVPLGDLYALVDAEFSSRFGGDRFATAQFAGIDLSTGQVSLVNAGHPPPLLIRARRVVGEVSVPATLPLGLGGDEPHVTTVDLEPNDRLLLYTDGVVETRRDHEAYGEERLVRDIEHVLNDELPVPEVVRRLNHRLVQWRGGPPDDDATIVLLEWRGRELPVP